MNSYAKKYESILHPIMYDKRDEIMSHMIKKLPELAKAQGLDTGFRTIINTGKGGGQVVFHLHIHLLGGSNLPGFE